jgi:hypothetical protein
MKIGSGSQFWYRPRMQVAVIDHPGSRQKERFLTATPVADFLASIPLPGGEPGTRRRRLLSQLKTAFIKEMETR